MLPFDLAQFDEVEGENSTAKAIEAIGKHYLTSAGLERHGGALLLSRLYMRYVTEREWSSANADSCRKDTLDQLRAFMTWTIHTKELFSVGSRCFRRVLKLNPVRLSVLYKSTVKSSSQDRLRRFKLCCQRSSP